jgi:hypothetical protein
MIGEQVPESFIISQLLSELLPSAQKKTPQNNNENK